MGFVLTLMYVAFAILSPAELFPELGEYRVMLWLAVAVLIASIPALLRQNPLRQPQVCLMLAMAPIIALSRLMNGGVSSMLGAMNEFFPAAMVFFMLVLNVTSMRRFQVLTGLLVVISLYLGVRGIIAFRVDDEHDPFVLVQPVDLPDGGRSHYLRIRSLGFLNDPNDFSQFLLLFLPFILLAWNHRRLFRSLLFCVLPTIATLVGVYLTFSRGALIGLAVIALFFLRDRLGARSSVFLTPLVIAGTLAMNQSGRAMSIQDGSALGRVNAWSDGLGMLRSSPLWGIGFNRFTEFHERTAHNSFVLCFSELGVIGSFCWVGLLVACVVGVQAFMRSHTFSTGPAQRWAAAMRSALYTVLVTSWFLSRTYAITLFLVLGMAAALAALDGASDQEKANGTGWLRPTCWILPLLFMAVYATVRMRSL